MLTINADSHPLMNHFHRQGDEKRMPVIIAASDYADWLSATPATAAEFFRPFPPEKMTARPEPTPARSAQAKPKAKAELFGTTPE